MAAWLFVVAWLLAVAPTSQGATIHYTDERVAYRAAEGEANRLTVAPTHNLVRFTDDGATISAPSNCITDSPSSVRCRFFFGENLEILTGDRSDVVILKGAPASLITISGGLGRDHLVGSDGSALEESIAGGRGADVIKGRGGDDFLYGDGGADQFHCPSLRGADLLVGGEGADQLNGCRGDDELRGGDGRDALIGGRGRDLLRAGMGGDFLWGGRGRDELRGGDGNDLFFARDGATDRLRGSAGNDTAAVDPVDLMRSIETFFFHNF